MINNPGSSPFLTLEVNQWSELVEYGKIVQYPEDCVIVQFGTIVTKLYFVLEGEIKYSLMDGDGNEKIVAIVGKGAIFGEGPLFAKTPTNISAITLSECDVCELEEEQVLKFIQKKPQLAVEIIKSMNYKIAILIDQLADFSFNCTKGRIANLLYRLASNASDPNQDGIELFTNFTHDELAKLVGCSRVSTSRALSSLKRDGIIDYTRKTIIIKQVDKLKKLTRYGDYKEDFCS